MKKTMVICCILLCSLIGLFACTKNRNDAQPVPPPSGTDTTLPTDGDTLNPPKYAVGDTLILRGDTSNNDKTVLLYSGNGGVSTPGFPSFTALGKGFSATNDRTRSIMKFRIRNLDDSSRDNPPPVQKAVLYLYQYTDPAGLNPYAAQQHTENSAELHRIIGDWQDSTISWHTQPALAEGSANPLEDVVIIPAVITPLQAGANDNQVIDVTDMMRKIFADRSNKGFLLKLTNEDAEVGRSFGSFACPNANKRPKLVVYF
jgi:hypothetical protein